MHTDVSNFTRKLYATIDFYLSLSSRNKGKWKHGEKHMKYK